MEMAKVVEIPIVRSLLYKRLIPAIVYNTSA